MKNEQLWTTGSLSVASWSISQLQLLAPSQLFVILALSSKRITQKTITLWHSFQEYFVCFRNSRQDRLIIYIVNKSLSCCTSGFEQRSKCTKVVNKSREVTCIFSLRVVKFLCSNLGSKLPFVSSYLTLQLIKTLGTRLVFGSVEASSEGNATRPPQHYIISQPVKTRQSNSLQA